MNQLQGQKSLYLQQHESHPVNWMPYGPEALQKAADENKPIFLSIGYSSCHWCHVMAGESFSNQEIAEELNKHFVCIKVDREEYPDLDSYYQMACQLYSGSGGWPLNAFCLPNMQPYFAGTYFPPKRRGEQGPPSFKELIVELSRAYTDAPDQVLENAKNVTDKIKEGLIPKGKVDYQGHFPVPEAIMQAISEYKDEQWGGYGQPPKFPSFAFYEWAVEQMLEGMIPKEQGQHIVKTLEMMLMGGVSDHARGGIHRYSTDEKWLVPHFEKMLYDQAGYLRLLSKFGLIYPTPLVFDSIINTLDYLEREILSDEKYFFSAQDADSEGVEGLYFTFSKEEFIDIINQDEELEKNQEKILEWFQIQEEGHIGHQLNVISLNPEKKDEYFNREAWDQIRKVRTLLVEERKNRMPPSTDTKGVASWNFMIISALVDVIQYCSIDVIKNRAFQIIQNNLEGVFNTFIKSRDENKVKINHVNSIDHVIPYFEDYVTFCESQVRLFELTGNQLFKENFLGTLDFISKEFIEENKVYTRPISLNDHFMHPNAEVDCYDSSFKSPLATFLFLVRKAALLLDDVDYEKQYDQLFDQVKNDALKNPVSCGETLRAMTYPDEALRVIKYPKSWVDQEEFNKFRAYFMPRFVFHALDNEEDADTGEWQVCRFKACELQGKGLPNFLETLIPKQDLEEGQKGAE